MAKESTVGPLPAVKYSEKLGMSESFETNMPKVNTAYPLLPGLRTSLDFIAHNEALVAIAYLSEYAICVAEYVVPSVFTPSVSSNGS